MAAEAQLEPLTRGHRKRAKTRRLLVDAGLRVLARRGEGLTVSDVVAEADVSNGTFYNYFVDREALVDALAEHLVGTLAAAAASEPISDPALRFAVASTRVLRRAEEDATWGRVVLRLATRSGVHQNLDGYLRRDLTDGFAQGRFTIGADDATVDQVLGLLVMTIRRIVDGQAGPETTERAVERALRGLGVAAEESRELAARAG
jgi:AcrR family transcriptional regulator